MACIKVLWPADFWTNVNRIMTSIWVNRLVETVWHDSMEREERKKEK